MNASISMLELRRIEATILKNVYDVLLESHGVDVAQDVIGRAVSGSAIAQGEAFRREHDGEPDLEDFAGLLRFWEQDGALEVDIRHKAPDRLDFDVRRCRFSEMYREMGMGHIGHLLSCNRDGHFCVGYNPKMQLTRTQTIMQGADHCDFRYRLKDETQD